MSIIKQVTLQKIVAHDFRYDPRTLFPLIKQFWECAVEQNETNATKLLWCVYFLTCLHLRKDTQTSADLCKCSKEKF